MGVTAVAAATASACAFAISTSLQHRAASSAAGVRVRDLFKLLVRRPGWHLGLLMGGVGFVLHAVAVRQGPLVVVQPIVVSGVVLAMPVRAALDRRRPAKSDVAWATVTGTGLALLVVASDPSTGADERPGWHAVAFIVGGLLAASACSQLGVKTISDRRRGALLGSAAGILFGLVAGMLKILVLDPGDGLSTLVVIGALISVGGWGVILNQRAYQAARLAVCMPVLNIVDVLVAIAFGLYVFGEVPAHHPAALVAEGLGLLLMTLGVRLLARGEDIPSTRPALATSGSDSSHIRNRT